MAVKRKTAAGDVTAVVLAGGAATRMGGCDKGLVHFEGRPLVEHVLERMRAQCADVVISANRNTDVYGGYGCKVVSDDVAGYPGPLAGIAAALAEVRTEFAAAAPCDSPFVAEDYVARLREAFEGRPELMCAAASAEGVRQPVFTMVRASAKGAIEAFLAAGGRKVRAFLEEHGCRWVEFDELKSFENFNTQADLLAAQQTEKSS